MYVAIVLIFENRYFVLTSSNKYWRMIRKPWMAVNYVVAVSVGVPVYLDIPKDQEQSIDVVFEKQPCLRSLVSPVQVFVIADDITFLITSGSILGSLVGLEIARFSRSTRKWLQVFGAQRLSEKTLRLQKQFLRALIIQFSIPFFLLAVPLVSMMIATFQGIYSPKLNNFALLIVGSFGLFSTVFMVFAHAAYREVLTGYFEYWARRAGLRFHQERVISVVPSVVSAGRTPI